jgi:NADPH2:quinone reductase
MKAIRVHQLGEPEVLVLEDVDVPPAPAAGEVSIRVEAAGVNPVDCKMRRRPAPPAWGLTLPFIPGWDVAGVVQEVGPGGGAFKPGDEVFGMIAFPHPGRTYAEVTVAAAADLAARPAGLDAVHAAAVPLAALTAWQALFDAGALAAGQRVLIHAAAGGVGHFAVQLAKWRGAHVIGTASGRNVDFVLGLGADEVIDYTRTPLGGAVADLDLVLDPVGGEARAQSWALLKPGGLLLSIVGEPDRETAAAHGVRGQGVFVHTSGSQLGEIAALLAAGTLSPQVDRVYPLSDAAAAHHQVEGGHVRGKVVLQVRASG